MGRRRRKRRQKWGESWLFSALLGVGLALFCLWLTGPWVRPLLTGYLPRLHVGLTVEDGRVALTVQLAAPDRAVGEP